MTSFSGVRTKGFVAPFPKHRTALQYFPDSQHASSGIEVWSSVAATEDSASWVSLTTLEISTGGGKTTFAEELYDFLSGDSDKKASFFWEGPPPTDVGTYIIPQRLSTARHWKVDDLLPSNCTFQDCFFVAQDFDGIQKKHLSEMSGGQVARLLLLSVFERMMIDRHETSFLIIDEGFEGIDEVFANIILKNVVSIWNDKCEKSLRLLLINHFNPEVLLKGIDSKRLCLSHSSIQTQLIAGVEYLTTMVMMNEQ